MNYYQLSWLINKKNSIIHYLLCCRFYRLLHKHQFDAAETFARQFGLDVEVKRLILFEQYFGKHYLEIFYNSRRYTCRAVMWQNVNWPGSALTLSTLCSSHVSGIWCDGDKFSHTVIGLAAVPYPVMTAFMLHLFTVIWKLLYEETSCTTETLFIKVMTWLYDYCSTSFLLWSTACIQSKS